ncbi:MAG: hypothetical protein JNM19_00345 [Chitinophagaceae bacterium]|nr:hypothetical protein [Chitinophagaceae bacterium]
MQLAKLITPKRIKTLHCFYLTILVFVLSAFEPVLAQDNSPYSRYGIGDLVPSSNVANRAMGGISAGYTDYLGINFNNPASYSSFEARKEAKSKKLTAGRAVLDIGINFDNRTLTDPGNPVKFVANNALFSYVQVGMPIKKDWGITFGLRPVSRISYNIFKRERLIDPVTSLPIDSSLTRFQGDGGSYIASIGTGFALFSKLHTDSSKGGMIEKLSVGINAGYYFGKKDYTSRRTLINDTVEYYQANYETKTTYGNLFFSAGLQYMLPLKKNVLLTIGAYGNWGQKLNASEDIIRETFVFDDNLGNVRLDSVADLRDVKGKIEIPASYTIGFVLQKYAVMNKEGGWMIGVDFSQQNWNKYRYYGKVDSVKNKWELRVGGQFSPIPKRNYFSRVAYRFGFFTGPDYIKSGPKFSQSGVSFGLGLPMAISRQAPNQSTFINMAFEYGKRGNNDNLLKENLFRFSLGFSLSDIWFIKRKYD